MRRQSFSLANRSRPCGVDDKSVVVGLRAGTSRFAPRSARIRSARTEALEDLAVEFSAHGLSARDIEGERCRRSIEACTCSRRRDRNVALLRVSLPSSVALVTSQFSASRSFWRSLAGFFCRWCGTFPVLIWAFSVSLLRCFAAATIVASTIWRPLARLPACRGACRTGQPVLHRPALRVVLPKQPDRFGVGNLCRRAPAREPQEAKPVLNPQSETGLDRPRG